MFYYIFIISGHKLEEKQTWITEYWEICKCKYSITRNNPVCVSFERGVCRLLTVARSSRELFFKIRCYSEDKRTVMMMMIIMNL